jgi:hypothetical protein
MTAPAWTPREVAWEVLSLEVVAVALEVEVGTAAVDSMRGEEVLAGRVLGGEEGREEETWTTELVAEDTIDTGS